MQLQFFKTFRPWRSATKVCQDLVPQRDETYEVSLSIDYYLALPAARRMYINTQARARCTKRTFVSKALFKYILVKILCLITY